MKQGMNEISFRSPGRSKRRLVDVQYKMGKPFGLDQYVQLFLRSTDGDYHIYRSL